MTQSGHPRSGIIATYRFPFALDQYIRRRISYKIRQRAELRISDGPRFIFTLNITL
jgi:hypothetical protein